MNFSDGTLEGLDGVDELLRVAQVSLLRGRDDVLVDHVNHRQRFHLDLADVVAEENRLARLAFLGGENAHLFEEGNVLVTVEFVDSVAAGIDAPHTALDSLIRPFRIITVTVEHALVVRLQQVLRDGERLFTRLEAVRNNLKRLGGDGVQDSVDKRHVLRRTGGAELETVTTVRERRRTVTIFRRDFNGWDRVGAELQRLLRRRILTKSALLDSVQELSEGRAKVRGHDSRRRFHGTETEVVARGRDRKAHQVTVLVDGGNHGGHDERENFRVAGDGVDLLRVHQVEAVGSTDGPVVVLTGAVDASERLLLEKPREAVLGGNFLDDLHNHQVLVHLVDGVAEHRGELVLVRRDFTVTGLQRNAKLEALLLDLTHALEGGGGAGDRSHVAIAHLLATRRHRTGDGTAGELKIRAAVERVSRNQEDFLFQTNVGVHRRVADVVLHRLEHTLGLLVQGGGGAVKRRLLIESIAVVGHKRRRDEDSVFAKEDRRRRVEGKVTTGRVRGAHAAVRVGGTIRFTLKELLAGEGVVRGTIRREIHHGLVHLTRVTVTDTGGAHRLEPVAVHGRAVVHGPVEHRLGDDVSLQLGLDPGLILEQLGALAVLVQVLLRDRTTEAAGTVPLRRGRTRAHREHRLRPDAASPFRDARAPRLAANRAALRRQAHFLTQRRLFTRTHRTAPSVIALTSRARVYPLAIPLPVIDNPLRARSSPPPRVASPIPDRSIDRPMDRSILSRTCMSSRRTLKYAARDRVPRWNPTRSRPNSIPPGRAPPLAMSTARRDARGVGSIWVHTVLVYAIVGSLCVFRVLIKNARSTFDRS